MTRVLILDHSITHAAEMARALRVVGCESIVRNTVREAAGVLSREEIDAFAIAADQNTNWQQDVEALLPLLHEVLHAPRVFCVLRGPYRGAANRLWGARRGVKVVYERN